MYDSWKSWIMLYIRGKENGEMLKDSVINGPYKFKLKITAKDTDDVTDIYREERLEDHKGDDKLHYYSDIKAVNILLLGLPVDIYTLINHYQTAKEIWGRVKELTEGTEMTKQERESMLYDEFDKFTFEPGESIHSYYLRFAKLINDMNMISMTMTPMQINTKANQPRVIRCYNCKGEGHMAKQCTARKKLQATTNFKAHHVDAYDLDCDDEATSNEIFMANVSLVGSLNDDTVAPRYDFDTLSKLPHYDTYHDSDVLNSNIQELGYIENIVSTNESYDPPVTVSTPKVFPKKLPSTSEVLRNLNKVRDLLTKFDECIKRRTALSPHEIGSWEQSDIKGAFKKDVIPFSENLKETFKYFEKGFITKVKEMKDVFEQMEDEVDQCSVAKKSFEIEKKQLLINNDRLLVENIASDIM
ncbi:retrovirus-related pol polyprotein from transposon TNT 1-94 [Tanacetum coccineum]